MLELKSLLTEEQRKRAHEIFEVPEQFSDVADIMVHEVEWQVLLLMEKRTVTDEELRELIEDRQLANSSYLLIRDMFSRAVINKDTSAETLSWKASTFYRRYSYFAQYERYDFGRLGKEIIDALYEWQMEVYIGIYREDVQQKMKGIETWIHNQDFITLEEALEELEKHPDDIYILPCNCKSQKYFHSRMINVCTHTESWPNSEVDRGMAEHVTLEEAKRRVKQFNKHGLMQNGEAGGFCNCDGLCCFPLNMAYKLGSRGFYPRPHYRIDYHEDECIQCGRCTKICNFGAFHKDENGRVAFDRSKCWGCTICTTNCPKKAIHLIPISSGEEFLAD